METSKLEKIIHNYLPYKLQCELFWRHSDTKIEYERIGELVVIRPEYKDQYGLGFSCPTESKKFFVLYNYPFKDVKPVLHPFSDLTKDIEVNGKKINLFKLLYEMFGGGFSNYRSFEISTRHIYENPLKMISYETIQLYFENHFDVFGLIPEELATDINTL